MAEAVEGGREYLTLEEVHAELLKLLLQFDAFCKEHGLSYSLQAGTLLGAVRHKGFIPWDDDVDISMPRPDYERLISCQDDLGDHMYLMLSEDSAFAYPFIKLCTDEVRAQEPSYEGYLEENLWIDIFPMDGVPSSDSELAKIQKRINSAIRRNVWASVNHSNQPVYKRLIKILCGHFLRFGDQKAHMLRVVDEVARNPGYENATRVSSLLGGARHGWSIPKDGYEDMVEFEFEGHMLLAMGCWDEYLTKCYGDYMQLPPEDKRQTHCLKAWRVNSK